MIYPVSLMTYLTNKVVRYSDLQRPALMCIGTLRITVLNHASRFLYHYSLISFCTLRIIFYFEIDCFYLIDLLRCLKSTRKTCDCKSHSKNGRVLNIYRNLMFIDSYDKFFTCSYKKICRAHKNYIGTDLLVK